MNEASKQLKAFENSRKAKGEREIYAFIDLLSDMTDIKFPTDQFDLWPRTSDLKVLDHFARVVDRRANRLVEQGVSQT